MKFRLLLLVLFLWTSSCCQAHSAGGPKEDKIDQELKKCLDKEENQTTASTRECTDMAREAWDKKLNVVYKALSAKLKSEAKNKLVEAQKEWIRFRDKEIKLIIATYGSMDGTMWQCVAISKIMELNKNRAIDLEELLDTMKG